MAKSTRVLALASGGGHWIQLQRLRDVFDGTEVAFASTYGDYSAHVLPNRFHTFPDANRAQWTHLPRLVLRLALILIRERPQLVVTTGALPGLVALALAKLLFDSRTVWIDSIANCERLSTSGYYARRFADVYLTQWPHLAKADGPEFMGAVL